MPRNGSSNAPPAPRAPLGALWVLLGVNVLVYLGWQFAFRASGDAPTAEGTWVDAMAGQFLVSYQSVMAGRVWTLVTSEFSHIDPAHLFANMLALWVFGRDVLLRIGRLAFVQLYLVGGLVASLGHVAWQVLADDPSGALGASGSVMAIAVVYAALFPRRILLVNFFIPLPAALAVTAYIALDLAGAFGGIDKGVAHAAHLGGALYGFAFWLLFLRGAAPRS